MVGRSNWIAFGASARGTSHEASGQKNQDAFRLKNCAGADNLLLLSVSDGHGSSRSFRSDRGSVIAVEQALLTLHDFIQRLGPDAPLSRVRRQAESRWPRALIRAWRKAVRADVEASPLSPLDFAAFPEPPPVIVPGEEMPPAAYLAYGATLVAVAVTRRFILYAQLGDGDILAVMDGGSVTRPLPRHHEFMASQTISLCSPGAASYFQIRVVPCRAGVPAMVMASSDGYANCFGTDDGFFTVGADLFKYVRTYGAAFVAEKLEAWLRESSRNGSGDDITVALAARARS